VESGEHIDILPNGTAVATNGQHQAYFPGDIYQGQIELVTPDGLQLNSRPMGLSYFDGTNSVLIAELTNSVGVVVGDNQVVYPNAFTDFRADLRFTYTKAGFEQDIILRQQPPTPESLGLNPDTARLQILTEFFSPPQPTIETNTLPAQAGLTLTDETLGFGTMQMVPGRAFLLGTNATDTGVLVDKQWLLLDGRQFLVEEVPVDAILEGLANLPLTAMNSSPNQRSRMAARHLKLPSRRMAKTSSKARLTARADLPAKGFLLDYQTVTGTYTNYTFQGDTCYYISGSLTLLGTNTFEGGAVIKYATNGTILLSPGAIGSPSMIWNGAAYRPVIFTAIDDNSVGDTITGSTGSPTNYYGSPMLNLVTLSPVPTITGIRMSHAKTAISFSGASVNLYGAQFVNCQYGFAGGGATVNLRNALFGNFVTNFTASGGVTINAQNTTFSGSQCLWPNPAYNSGNSLVLNNCVFANITNLTTGYTTASGSYNGFYNTPNFGSVTATNTTYPFQTVGGGSYYFTSSCAFTNAGSTNIDSTLLASLRQKTTFPPMLYSNTPFSNNIVWNPQAQRDTNSSPNLGYHYDPIDYIVGGCDLYTNLTVTNGAVVSWFENQGAQSSSGQGYGISLNNGANLTFQGTATVPCWIARYNTVQEGSLGTRGWMGGVMINGSSTGLPQLNARFTKWAVTASDAGPIRDNWALGTSSFVDCEFYVGSFQAYDQSSVVMTNTLFFRVGLYVFGYGQPVIPNVTVQNCLCYDGFFSLNRYAGQPTTVWTVKDNAFDGTGFSFGDNLVSNTNYTKIDYNSYNTNNQSGLSYSYPYTPPPTNRLEIIGTHDVFVGNYNWQSSWFGNYYQPTNSLLINAGDLTADKVGLYHFTTQTNQAVEGFSLVDIGYHYVATDTNGIPLDSNGDGIPDYLEDANGDGLIDNGEMPWDLPDQNLIVWLKADAIPGLNNNASIGSWLDSSGQSNNATQGTTNNQPLYVTNTLNGYPIVRFNGTNSFNFLNNFLTGTTGLEALVVLKVATNLTSTIHTLWYFGEGGDLEYPDASGQLEDATASGSEQTLGVPAQPLTAYHIYEVAGATGSWTAWINGQMQGILPGNIYGPFTFTLGLGCNSYNNSHYFNGDVAEVLVFNRPLTVAERSTANVYLNGKYGLVPAVPAAPTNLVALAISTNQIGLTWSEALTNGGATQVSVARSTASNGTFQVVAQVSGGTSYVDTNLAAGTTYYYQVQAINLTQWSAYSGMAWATTLTNGASLPFGNLLLWLKADSGLTQTGTNTPVNFWADQSGNTNSATQGMLANQPLWVSGVLNGLPVMRFNGTNSDFGLPDFIFSVNYSTNLLTQMEALVVLKVGTNLTAGAHSLWRFGDAGDLEYPNGSGHVVDGTASGNVDDDLGVPAQPLTSYHVYEVAGGATWTAWINGQMQGSLANIYGGSSFPLGLGYDSGGGNHYFNGDVAEVLVFNRTLSGDERLAVGSYLISKYGLAQYAFNSSLPATPTNLTATAVTPTELSIQCSPASTNATEFIIQRKSGVGGAYQEIGSAFAVTNFLDTTVSPSIEYFYKIIAANYFGQSGYSTEISPPVVTLTLISTNAYMTTGSTNVLVTQASDAYGTVNQFQIVNNLNPYIVIGSGTSVPCTNIWVPHFQTSYSLAALATDSLGNSRYSAPVVDSVYLDSNGDGIPDYLQVLQGNNPLNPWPSPGTNATVLNFTLLIPTNAVIVP
jgi:hypothetical protein